MSALQLPPQFHDVQTACILGSGCSSFTSQVKVTATAAYADVPGMPPHSVEHQKGELLRASVRGTELLIFNGRFHLYEGLSAAQLAAPVELCRQAGVKQLLVTNAAGSCSPYVSAPSLMSITDQINLTGCSPLTGTNDYRTGPRYPSMDAVYSRRMQECIKKAARDEDLFIYEGVYGSIAGPQTPTPAELAMYRGFGMSAVGMSTVAETIAAVHAGMEIGGISLITDSPSGGPVTPKEARRGAQKKANELNRLLIKVLETL
ncbi:MAG: purine-nucleoside phosphorylase [Fibrobacterota bacterium]